MPHDVKTRTYRIRNSEKCFRFKPEAFMNHAPHNKGIYELVTFDDNQTPNVLYVGAAFEKTIFECLEGHASGSLDPKADEILSKYPNLYFDYLEETGAKSMDDAQDIYWWLVQKHKPPYNDSTSIKPSNRPGTIEVVELD